MAKKYIENIKLKSAKTRIFNLLLVHKTVNIFEVLELSSGEYLPVSKMEPGEVKVYGGGGLTSQTHSQSNINYKTIGIGRVGARCGCVFIIDPNSWVTDNALFLSRLKKEYDLNFLVHFLNYLDLNRFANTASQPVISLKRIAGVELPDIEIKEQIEISSLLDEIERGKEFFETDKFGINESIKDINIILSLQTEFRTQQTLLTQLRQSILHEAVQGKLTKKFRELAKSVQLDDIRVPGTSPGWTAAKQPETGAELLARIRAEKAELIRQGKLRKEKPLPPITEAEKPFELPEGWVWCRLGEVSLNISTGPFGSMLHKSDYISAGIPVVNPMNIVNNQIIPHWSMTVSIKMADSLESYKLLEGDVVIGRRGEMGRCACVTANEAGWLCGTGSFFIRLTPSFDRSFFVRLFKSKYVVDSLLGSSVGSTMDNLNHRILNSLLIPLPPVAEQQAIVVQVEQLLSQVTALETENKKQQAELGRLMQAVLSEAFAGKKEVVEL